MPPPLLGLQQSLFIPCSHLSHGYFSAMCRTVSKVVHSHAFVSKSLLTRLNTHSLLPNVSSAECQQRAPS
ncbi:hypothetical protein I79_008594 [Cricetulus griseus]|uniref:Uncharacterized protein n=1 Tax=Cricetulus griseus TaxID=10029 RepID=G3HDL1_CRIGR|nr:hypothetical protein I79_008594 [Cricetulus griseus]